MAFLGDIEASSIILRDVSDPTHPTDGPVQISLFTGALGGAVGIGGHGLDGTISMSDSNGSTNIVLDAAACTFNIGGGGPGGDGTISIADTSGMFSPARG